jgi:hypothetical protein
VGFDYQIHFNCIVFQPHFPIHPSGNIPPQ